MGKYVSKKIKKLAEQMINSFSYIPGAIKREKFSKLGNYKPKKQAIELIKIVKEFNNLSFLESRYNNTSKCEVLWGEWSLTLKSDNPDYLEYDKVGFDLTISIAGKDPIYKFFYLVISKHALERLLERGETECNNSFDMKNLLNKIIKKLILRCLEIWKNSLNTKEVEGFEVIDEMFLPIVMEKGFNFKKEPSLVFTIKTAIPNKKNLEEQRKLKENIFDYEDLLIPSKVNLHNQTIQELSSMSTLSKT